MRIAFSFIVVLFCSMPLWAQNELSEEAMRLKIDSLENTFKYTHGEITLQGGIGKITVPDGFKSLEPVQAEKVLVEVWGNPAGKNLTLGLILREHQGIIADTGYVFNIQYDEIGYVDDNDADKINYDDLLKQMKEETIEENKERKKGGFEPIEVVGWAASPFYDKSRKILHWAKEFKFGGQEVNTLNYNIRVLGRKGVIVLNAIATINDLPAVNRDINQVLDIVKFSDGFQYKDYDSKVDKVAAWTIGGLVAGKVLAKVGFLALILKFWKIIALAVVGAFTLFKKKIFGSKKEETPIDQSIPPSNYNNETPL